jgi:hypothetical protein
MPRKARIDAPGAVHHIMARGIERRKIFRNDDDRNEFLERLEFILSETHTPCYWAHRKLGINQTELARKLGLSLPAVCAAVRNGQKIVQELQLWGLLNFEVMYKSELSLAE